MRQESALIVIVLIVAIFVFLLAVAENSAPSLVSTTPIATTTATSTLSGFGSGVEGSVRITCTTYPQDPACATHVFIIHAYQGTSAVAEISTDASGAFRAERLHGEYELRIDDAESLHCISVGVVIPENSFISTDISCKAGTP